MPLADAYFPPVSAAVSHEAGPAAEAPADVPPGLLAGLGVFAALGLLTANGLLTAACVLVLAVLVKLLWRPGEPPVLLFAASYQWVQVSAKVFHADVFGVYVGTLSPSPQIETATWLSLVGLVVLALGMRLALRHTPALGERLKEGIADFSVSRAFWVYLAFTSAATTFKTIAYLSPSITQLVLPLVTLQWAAFFVLGYLVLTRREGYGLFLLAFGIEFIQGIGFFSGFKTVFFVTLLIIAASRTRITAGIVAAGGLGVVILLVLGSAWTVVKPAFRGQISGGQGGQSVSADRTSTIGRLWTLTSDLTANDLVVGLDPLFRRVAYTDYFALTMDYVPAERPYDRGALWGLAVRHVLTPRIFFPSKPRLLSDSEVTMAYTGQYLASDDEGTSISIGYMGESYADFGPVGMFGVVFALGMGWSLMYVFFVRRARVPLLGVSVALVVLLQAYQFEMASIKLLGGVLTKFIVLAALFRFLEPRLIGWLGGDPADQADARADEPEPGVDYAALA